ncbi:MAG: penicillin-binding protein 2 [Woeseia sp.]|nr:penicillin-binding protein 2 [Woeseia sp.]
MSPIAPIKDHHSETRLFVTRVILTSIASVFLLSLVAARLIQLQIFEYELFAKQSQGNQIRIQAIPPIRGLIFDRNGRILAENLPSYQLELIPEQVPDINDTLQRLSQIGLIPEEEINEFLKRSRTSQRFKPITLRSRLSDEEISRFAVQSPRFPGVDLQPRLARYYPDGELFAHVIGYVGALSASDLRRLEQRRYAGTSRIGKTGIEQFNEEPLHGSAGFHQVVTNALGRQIPIEASNYLDSEPTEQDPKPGSNIHLSLDIDLQRVAYDAMKKRRGAVVAINPKNGEILALVSSPSFDPNDFATGMTTSEYSRLENDQDYPLFNRAVSGTYPPGSTIKPALAIAALEIGATNLKRRSLCRGWYSLPGSTHRYRDWKPEGHGQVNLKDAIEQSCDVYFYEISRDIGIDNMHYYLNQFGLGQNTGLDLSEEADGLVPSRQWKRRNFTDRENQIWFPGETVIASIGQGYMLATPLQLANLAATLANRGKRSQPHLVTAFEDPLTNQRIPVTFSSIPSVEISNESHWEEVLDAMHNVLQGETGTARAASLDAPYKMAGKSGTAQVFSMGQTESYNEEEIDARLRDHALFISFAPFDDPQIAVAVVIENGSSGSLVAAPVARAVMDQHLGYKSDAI